MKFIKGLLPTPPLLSTIFSPSLLSFFFDFTGQAGVPAERLRDTDGGLMTQEAPDIRKIKDLQGQFPPGYQGMFFVPRENEVHQRIATYTPPFNYILTFTLIFFFPLYR
jgi:hypothetical protein